MNSTFVDIKCLQTTSSSCKHQRFHSTNGSPREGRRQHLPFLKQVSRDVSFIEEQKPTNAEVAEIEEKKQKLINSEVFDDVRLEEFCKSMLNPSLTAKFSLLPTRGFGKPCSRKDVELLADWIQTQESEMLKTTKASELFERAQIVYGKCIRELVRQVAVQCMERGVLFDKVLRAYFFLFEKVLMSYKKDIAKREFANRSKITKLHELYLGKLDQLRKKTYEQADQLRKTKDELEVAQHAIEISNTKEANYKERIRIIQQHYEDTKRKLSEYEKEPAEHAPVSTSTEGKPPKLLQFYNMAPDRKKRADPFLDKKLAENMDELGEDENRSLAFARKLFKHQVLKFIRFDRGTTGSAVKVLNSKSTQTKLKEFLIPAVQVESSVPLPVRQVFRKRVSMIWKAQSVAENAMVLERLSESLKDVDLILLSNDVEILNEEAQMQHANLKFIVERCMDFTSAAILHRDFMSMQIKKLKVDLQEKEKTAKMAERKYRVLDQENLRLSEIVEQLEIGLSQLRRELAELKKRDISPEVKIKVVAEGGEELKAPSWTAFKEFQLGRRKILYKRSSNLPSTILVEKFNAEAVKAKATMTVKTLLRQLTTVFLDYKQQSHDSPQVRSQEFSHFTYEWLMTKHGLRRVTEQKFLHILAASLHFKDHKRVHLFGRFLQLYEPLFNEDLKFYAIVTDAMIKWGLAPDAIEVEDPLLEQDVVYCVLSEVLKPKFPDLDLPKLKYELEPYSHRSGFIHQYDFVNFSLRKFRLLLSTNKNFVVDLFKAADLNGDGYLELEEFEVLCHHIVKDKRRVAGIGRIFESSADLMLKLEETDEPKPVISLEKFSALSIEFDLFGLDAQHDFMGVETEADILEAFNNLKDNAERIFSSMRLQLQQTLEDHESITRSIELLQSKLSLEGSERSLFLAFKLLEAETKLRYCEFYLRRFQPRLFRYVEGTAEVLDLEEC